MISFLHLLTAPGHAPASMSATMRSRPAKRQRFDRCESCSLQIFANDIVTICAKKRIKHTTNSGGAAYPPRALHTRAARLRDYETGRDGLAGKGKDGARDTLRLPRSHDRCGIDSRKQQESRSENG